MVKQNLDIEPEKSEQTVFMFVQISLSYYEEFYRIFYKLFQRSQHKIGYAELLFLSILSL